MAVSQTAEYALRAVVWLACRWRPDGGEPQTAPQLAGATGVPPSYLPKVLQPLIRGGLVTAQRGLHGGYTLRRDPAELSVLDVVQCVDPIPKLEAAAPRDADRDASLSPLQALLNGVADDVERRFEDTRIRALIPANHAPDPPKPRDDA